MPKISVVIPLYNKENFIKETLESVLNQTFTDFEVILVNDGSTDKSGEIVAQFKDERIRFFEQENSGVSKTRNNGIYKASSELIAFLDADDYWYPNHLKEIMDLYETFPNCGMYGSRYYMKISDDFSLQTSYSPTVTDDFKGILPDYFLSSMHYRVGLTSAVAIPKKILLQYSCFNTSLNGHEDLELFTKIAIENPVAVTNNFTVQYNFAVENQLSKIQFIQKKIINLDQFISYEKANSSLKKFIDLYRLEYAIQYRIIGENQESNRLFNQIATKIPFKTRILLKLPSFLLRFLLKTKRYLRKNGIDFTIYH
ncbi:MAG: glycosyltransferase family 2 protein [Flavobacterium sp.]|jgi:glycosyltransferase involved in cell wall biosynthesis|nr:glycosyltransferase family 2 protein [Flavobacterium sp.]